MSLLANIRTLTFRRLQILSIHHEAYLPYLLALVVGLIAGFAAVTFRHLISAFDWLFFDRLAGGLSFLGDPRVILIPAVGGLLVGPIIYFFAREAKGHGVPEVMLAVETQGGRIRPRVAVIKSLASALCIGSGGSVGREGPIVQIGSAAASAVGQWLRLSEENIRLLVAAGAAGGISATFNAPIAGVFFALEIILRRFNVRNFSIVVLSSVVADALAHAFLGDRPSFVIPRYALESPLELPLYVLLGILAAGAALAFIALLYRTEDLFDSLRLADYLKPAVGGLAIGALGLWYADLFGVGYGSGPSANAITEALGGDKTLVTLMSLAGLKILATSLTIGSGGSGGVFAPSLFIGAMLGGGFGIMVHDLLPDATAAPGAYAVVGMAAVFAAAARAPITSVLILFEMTRDYNIILPLMTAVAVSTVVAQIIRHDTIYTLKLRRRGIDITERQEEPLLRTIPVGQAMTHSFDVISEDATVRELMERFSANGQAGGIPVLDGQKRLVGIVTLSDIERHLDKDPATLKVGDIATRNPVSIYPDQTLEEATRRLGSQGLRQLPVVSRRDPKLLLGLLRRSDVINAYSRVSTGRAPSAATPMGVPDLRAYGTELIELDIDPDSPLVGMCIRELGLPRDSIVVSILREGSPIVPRGDVVLEAGDHVVVATLPPALPELMHLMDEGPDSTSSGK